jgi:hypothetical protein
MKWLLVIFTSICIACDPVNNYQNIIVNKTKYDIKITAFYEGVKKQEIVIAPFGEYIKYRSSIGSSNVGGVFNTHFNVDSATIVFNQLKVISQSCDKEYLQGCYSIIKNVGGFAKDENLIFSKKHEYKYQIIFDDTDFERATQL